MSFAHVTLPTTDVDGTRHFFENVMKWRTLAMPQNIDIEAAWLEIAEGQQIHILGIGDTEPAKDQEFGRHFALFHPGDQFDEIGQLVLENGGELVAPIRPTPFRRMFFRDPNGYMFELIDSLQYAPE